MKVLTGILLLCVVVLSVEARKRCPTSRGDCICTLELDPVCSTDGCDYGNPCMMKCAGGTLKNRGRCRKYAYYGRK